MQRADSFSKTWARTALGQVQQRDSRLRGHDALLRAEVTRRPPDRELAELRTTSQRRLARGRQMSARVLRDNALSLRARHR